ncbi:MAG: DUF58 domain-containing protein [Polyangiaceae bacterium]|nr:DUF58 domain-containing protein [Polyangiaceae bacterium]
MSNLFDRIFALFRRDSPAAQSKVRPHETKRGRSKVQDAERFDEDFLKRPEGLALSSRKLQQGGYRGERRAKKRGSGVEFADHRPYVLGDDIRSLDFGVYQRLGKLLIRLYEEEEDLSIYFLIDTSASMAGRDGAQFRSMQRLVAALSYVGLARLDRVSLVGLSDQGNLQLPPTRGKQRVFRLLRFLSELKPSGGTDLEARIKLFVSARPRKGLVFLASDFFDDRGFERGLNVLRYHRFEVVALQFDESGRGGDALRGQRSLVDMETNQRVSVVVDDRLHQRVHEKRERRSQDLLQFCRSKGVELFQLDPARKVEELVFQVLGRSRTKDEGAEEAPGLSRVNR